MKSILEPIVSRFWLRCRLPKLTLGRLLAAPGRSKNAPKSTRVKQKAPNPYFYLQAAQEGPRGLPDPPEIIFGQISFDVACLWGT